MKFLVGAASLAVLLFVGYYFWGEYQRTSAASERAADRQAAEAELYEAARATPGDKARLRSFCDTTNDRLSGDLRDNQFAEHLVRNCRALGYLF